MPRPTDDKRVDVIEVEFAAPHLVRVMETNLTAKNAEAFIEMAVLRRGVENQFYTTAPVRQFRDGDHYQQKP